MDKFTKQILLDVQVDKSSLDTVQKDISNLKKFKLIDDSSAEKLSKSLEEYEKKQLAIKRLQEDIVKLRKLDTDESKAVVEELQEQQKLIAGDTESLLPDELQDKDDGLDLEQFKSSFASTMSGIAASFLKNLADVFSNAWKEAEEMLEFSQLSNARTRELSFQYGFTGSQAYGYTQAMQMVGLESEEDLMYANQQELAQFREAFDKYTTKYEELYDSGFFETMQEYQYEMEDFKQEMQLEVVGFFMDNKTTIMNGMKALMSMAEGVLSIVGPILDFFSKGADRDSSQRTAATNDIINTYSSSTSKNMSVKIDNQFNNVSQSDKTWLANSGSLVTEQLIKAIGEI